MPIQHCSCVVHLNGDRNFAIPKEDVTIAEIVLLRMIHGDDAVVDIDPTFMDKAGTLRAERDRLASAYGHREAIAGLVQKIFSEVQVQGLSTMEDIGMDDTPLPPPRVAKQIRDLPVERVDLSGPIDGALPLDDEDAPAVEGEAQIDPAHAAAEMDDIPMTNIEKARAAKAANRLLRAAAPA